MWLEAWSLSGSSSSSLSIFFFFLSTWLLALEISLGEEGEREGDLMGEEGERST
jgi:hypothetical protein